jgi:hypothetical protein
MDIPSEILTVLISEIFDCGYFGSKEFKDQYINEVLDRHRILDVNVYRVYSVNELNNMLEGTIFHHKSRGRCWIIMKANGRKSVQFEKSSPIDLIADVDPWDQPMRLLYTPA